MQLCSCSELLRICAYTVPIFVIVYIFESLLMCVLFGCYRTDPVWTDQIYCRVSCDPDGPCEYLDEVDFRLIILAFNNTNSLSETLLSVLELETLGDRVSVDIWIDQSKENKIDRGISRAMGYFVRMFTKLGKGRVCIHHQPHHVGVEGQWLNTWKPKRNTTEMAMIIEDSVTISPYIYKWLKMVVNKYDKQCGGQLSGYMLHMESPQFYKTGLKTIGGNKYHPVFLYPVMGMGCFAPDPNTWRGFQQWFKRIPYLKGIEKTNWYELYTKVTNTKRSLNLWYTKYTQLNKKFILHPNLLSYLKQGDVLLCKKRQGESELFMKRRIPDTQFLLQKWDPFFEILIDFGDIKRYNLSQQICTGKCCFKYTRDCFYH